MYVTTTLVILMVAAMHALLVNTLQLQVNVGGDEYSVISRPAKTEGSSKVSK